MWIFKATIFGALVVITNGEVHLTECGQMVCEHFCDWNNGYQCRCLHGYHFDPEDITRCRPMTPGCLPGYYSNPADPRTCVDLNECQVNPCQHLCNNIRGSFQCACRTGFYVNPQDRTKCIARYPNCPAGYVVNPRNASSCEDIDECRANPCQHLCYNLRGSFQCACRPGFYVNPQDRTKCIAQQSNCPAGYVVNPRNASSCEDIDECRANPCDHLCYNLRGSFQCACRTGFYVNPQDRTKCIVSAQQSNCPSGYVVNPRNASSCEDIDECRTPGLCEHKCVNLQGSYRCSCYSGFVVSAADNSKCQTIKQCSAAVDVLLLIDSTNSMGFSNFQLLLSFVSEIVQHFQVGNSKAKFSSILFGDVVQVLFRLEDHNSSDNITSAILDAPYLGGVTITNEAFDYVRENDWFSNANGGRSNAPDVLAVFIDSRSTTQDLTRSAAENLKNQGVKIVAVGITDRVSVPELSSVVSTREDLLLAQDFEHLDYVQQQLDWRICPDNNNGI